MFTRTINSFEFEANATLNIAEMHSHAKGFVYSVLVLSLNIKSIKF